MTNKKFNIIRSISSLITNTNQENKRVYYSHGITHSRVLARVLGGILGGVLVALGLLLAACPTSSAGSGDSDGNGDGNGGDNGNGGGNTTYPYICNNGTPVAGNDATADNITRCQSCHSGFIITANNTCNHRYICNNGTPTENTDATGDNVTQCASCIPNYLLTANNSCSNDRDGDGVLNINDIDNDNNGLIEISNLTMLHNMRYNRAGTSYKTSNADTGSTVGAPTSATTNCSTATGGVYLCGYELTQDLTFDKDGDGTFWVDGSGDYTLDADDSTDPYFVVANDGSGGWIPMGTSVSISFIAIFEGNGYTITGLATNTKQAYTYVGMFGVIGTGAHIRNVGLVNNLANYNGSESSVYIGGLAGNQQNGSITASYTTGSASGNDEGSNRIGGLVGYQQNGSITASYATGSVSGGGGTYDYTGGLVGSQASGSITASYATGNISGGAGGNDLTGGLVGYRTGGSITASYATGNADGDAGGSDYTGGLVGWQRGGSITASYATGSANGGAGIGDYAGVLIGRSTGGSHTASYGFGTATGENSGIDGTNLPTGVTMATALTAANLTGCVGIANEKAYTSQTTCEATSIVANACAWSSGTCSDGSSAVDGITCSAFTTQSTCPVSAISNKPAGTWNGNVWNAAGSGTAGAWDFGTSSQAPALRYSDYDGSGNTYNCNQFPSNVTCGSTLLPGQR